MDQEKKALVFESTVKKFCADQKADKLQRQNCRSLFVDVSLNEEKVVLSS